MDERAAVKPALDRRTPELAHEVRRNLIVYLTIAPAASAGISGLVALAAGLDRVAIGVGVILFAISLAYLIPVAAVLLALAYVFDCWPAFLRRRFLQTRWGIEPTELSGQAWRRYMRYRGFQLAYLRGVLVASVFAMMGLLAVWAVWDKSQLRFVGLWAVIIVLSGQLAAYAWVVRQVVAAHQEAAAFPRAR